MFLSEASVTMPCVYFGKSKTSKNVTVSPRRQSKPRRALTIREPSKSLSRTKK
jgi:hypothetical protein